MIGKDLLTFARSSALICAAGSLFVLGACTTPMSGGTPASASADLKPTQGNRASGTARFTQAGGRVQVEVRVSGLTPNQEHGFHVHETGDCSAPDAMSAGGHFNPTAAPHGPPGAPHHRGDMPSLKADAAGQATARFDLDGALTGSGGVDLIGKAVIVHAMPDDYTTQPTGNSGARIACGVIAG